MRRDGIVVTTLAPRPIGPGFNSWSNRTLCHHVAAVDKLLTLNCLGGGTKQCMKGATIGSCLLCITLSALFYIFTCPPFTFLITCVSSRRLRYVSGA